jgi:hypothetical protein
MASSLNNTLETRLCAIKILGIFGKLRPVHFTPPPEFSVFSIEKLAIFADDPNPTTRWGARVPEQMSYSQCPSSEELVSLWASFWYKLHLSLGSINFVTDDRNEIDEASVVGHDYPVDVPVYLIHDDLAEPTLQH